MVCAVSPCVCVCAMYSYAAMYSFVLQRGKPTLTRPREYLILERRKQEELREEANAMVNYNKQFDLKVCAPIARYPTSK